MTDSVILLGIIIGIGIGSFLITLYLSFRWDLGTKLSKGEIRKSIVISFTIIYFILLLLSFNRTMDLATTNNTTFTINTLNAAANATAQTVPIQAIGNFTQNFLYLYIVIIGFYFGSRLGEEVKKLKELSKIHSIDIIKRRYAMGEIDSKTFKKMAKELKELAESYLFSIDAELEDDLNKRIIPSKLKDIFKTNDIVLSDKALVTKEKENEWKITDEKEFIVRKEDGKLNIYAES